MSVDPIMLALMKKQLPCYDTRKTTPLTLEWDGEIGERETMDFVGTTFVKMMNEPPSYEELSAATFHVDCTEGFEEEFSNLAVMDGREQGYPFIGVSVNSTGAALCLCFPEDCTLEGVSYKKGLYLAKQEFTESGYIFVFIDKVYLPSVTTGELKTIDPKFLPSGGGDIEHIYVHNATDYGLFYAWSNTEDNQCVMTLPSEIVSQVKGALERGKMLFWHETNDMNGMVEKSSFDILFNDSMQISAEGVTRNMFLVLVPDFTGTGTFAMVGIALTDDENGIMQVQSYGL